jgi:DNA-binding transcriptional regulator YiaG
MYIAYKVGGLSKQSIRATSFSKEVDYFEEIGQDVYHSQGRLISYFVAGTLGLLTPMYLQAGSATANWNINQIAFDQVQVPVILNPSASARDISHVRRVLKISVTELAKIFGVSRQAVHDWINGGALSSRNAQRLSLLAEVADVFVESGVDISPQMLRRMVGSGQSILDLFKDGSNIVQEARQLVMTLSREATQRQRMSERLSDRLKVELPVNAFGLAPLHEST